MAGVAGFLEYSAGLLGEAGGLGRVGGDVGLWLGDAFAIEHAIVGQRKTECPAVAVCGGAGTQIDGPARAPAPVWVVGHG